MNEVDLYAGREQTLIKHLILQKYLERFAHIVGSRWTSITYVDCFSGPWNVRSDDLRDSSFSIALDELRKAKETHRLKGKTLKLRCFFLEKEASAYARLKQFADEIHDVEVRTRNDQLETSIDAILSFVRQGGPETFPFIFIDPTGWTGFAMQNIAPLLKLNPGEVLINFMTGHIKRFIESPQDETRESFIRLLGSADFKSRIEGLAGQDLEDALVALYSDSVKRTGQFNYLSHAIVLHPEKDRTHFDLIYATRHEKGVEVFKDAEKKAMTEGEHARAEAQRRSRESKSGQSEFLFTDRSSHGSAYYESLRSRYLARSRESVRRQMSAKQRVPYDDAWILALAQPLTWESDLKEWIDAWVKEGALKIEGMTERQRVPHRGKGNILVWLAG